MMRDNRIRRMPMALSALVALALAVLPLPAALDALRPDFLVLVVFYWSIESPRAGGLTLAFFAGIALDVIKGDACEEGQCESTGTGRFDGPVKDHQHQKIR